MVTIARCRGSTPLALLRSCCGNPRDRAGENTEAGAGARIQGAAPKEGYVPPWIWIEDRGGGPLDRTMGGDWTLRRDAVAIHVIGKDAEETGNIVAVVEAALDNVCGERVMLAGYDDIEVEWLTIESPGDERFEDEPDGVARIAGRDRDLA